MDQVSVDLLYGKENTRKDHSGNDFSQGKYGQVLVPVAEWNVSHDKRRYNRQPVDRKFIILILVFLLGMATST